MAIIPTPPDWRVTVTCLCYSSVEDNIWRSSAIALFKRTSCKGLQLLCCYVPLSRPTLMLLSHCGEYSCEYEYLNFAVNSPKNCDWIVNIFISVTPRLSSVLDLSLPISYEYITNAYQRLPMLANALRIANERCQCLRTLYQRYQWLTNAYENRRRMTVFATFAEI